MKRAYEIVMIVFQLRDEHPCGSRGSLACKSTVKNTGFQRQSNGQKFIRSSYLHNRLFYPWYVTHCFNSGRVDRGTGMEQVFVPTAQVDPTDLIM